KDLSELLSEARRQAAARNGRRDSRCSNRRSARGGAAFRRLKADLNTPVVIAIDGTSASGKSTNSKLVAKALGYVHVDTGAMYRTLAWHCLKNGIDVHNPKAVASACRNWRTKLDCVDNKVRLLVNDYYPEKEI